MYPEKITPAYLNSNPGVIFVFGDNGGRWGKAGAAICRDCENSYGFITKIHPSNTNSSFYNPETYKEIYEREIKALTEKIKSNPDKLFLISKLGGGLANKYFIYEKVIQPNIKNDLKEFGNIVFL